MNWDEAKFMEPVLDKVKRTALWANRPFNYGELCALVSGYAGERQEVSNAFRPVGIGGVDDWSYRPRGGGVLVLS